MTKTRQAGTGEGARTDYSEILAPYNGYMTEVEEAIRGHFHSDVALIPSISSYLIGGGGKRIRPLLVIASSKLCGYHDGPAMIDYSVVAEYIHAATLLHDDVVDEADLRRGSESANIKFGNQASVLVGDFLFAKAFQIMSEGSDMRIVQAVSVATKNLAEGEVLQLVNTCNLDATEEIYMDTIFRKTGALIMACLQIGAILGGADEEREDALAQYGKRVGIAFQLMDDVLDYTAKAEKWGKPLGADLAEGKVTLPLIRAYGTGTDEERKLIAKAIEDENGGRDYLEPVLEILNRRGALAYTADLARTHVEEAKLALSGFGPSPHLDALIGIADYIVERDI